MSEARPPRRVVTAHDGGGLGVIASDGAPPSSVAVADGATFHEMWVTASSPAPIALDEPEPVSAEEPLGPPRNGTRVRIVDMPPGVGSPMHRTESVDYGVVLMGTITLVLDGGDERDLQPGDLVVQRGTDHAWENRGQGPARMLFVLVAGRFEPAMRDAVDALETP